MINRIQFYVCKLVFPLCTFLLSLGLSVDGLAVNNARLTLLKVDSMPNVKTMVNWLTR